MGRNDSISDDALIEAIQQGDEDAAACLYHRHIDRVHRICYRILLDPAQVPDCVQEVWMKVFRSLGWFRREKPFASWLNSVTAHMAIDYYRKHKRHGTRVEIDESQMELLATEEPEAGCRSDGEVILRRIHEALEEISVNQRTAFVLRYFEDVPIPEIARLLGCNEGTVRTHIHRSLVALRARLAETLRQ